MNENKKTSVPDPKSGNEEKTADRTFIIISISLIVAAVILILVHIIFKLSYEKIPVGGEFLLHLGIACLISGLLIFSVERITARFHLRLYKTTLGAVSDTVSAIFGQFVPEEISREIVNYVYKTDIYYKDYEVDMTGMEVEIEGEKLLKFRAASVVEVHNPTSSTVEYTTPIKEINVDAGVKVPFVRFRRMQILDNKRQVIKELDESDFRAQDRLRKMDGRYEVDLNVEMEIKPRDFIFLRVYKTLYLRREKDWCNIALVKPAINMTLTAQFPEEKYRYWASACRPNTTEDYPDRFNVSYLPGYRIEVRIIGGILPHQSITLAYSRKVEAQT